MYNIFRMNCYGDHVLPRRAPRLIAALIVLTLAFTAQARTLLFDSAKPSVNIGTIGHIDHGKTTLTAAIVKVLDEDGYPTTVISPQTMRASGSIPGSSTAAERTRGVTINTNHVEFESESLRYNLVDPVSRADYIKNMITGETQVDGAILVVAAPDGPMPQTREHILLARQTGVPAIAVFLNRADLVDPETADHVELAIREILDDYGYTDALIVRGNAESALAGDPYALDQIRQFIHVLDGAVPLPAADVDKPFLMAIEDVYSIPSRGSSGQDSVTSGRVERGVIKVGDEIEVVGIHPTSSAVVSSVTTLKDLSGQPLSQELELRGADGGPVIPVKGQVVCKPGSITPHTRFNAEVYVLTADESGISAPLYNGQTLQFYFLTTDVFGSISLSENTEPTLPGDDIIGLIELQTPVAMEQGSRFALRQGNVTVGVGVVVEIIN